MQIDISQNKLEFLLFSNNGYIAYCHKLGRYSHHTIRNKVIDLNQFLDFVTKINPSPTLSAVTAEVLLIYITSLSENYSPASMARKIATLKTFLNLLQKNYSFRCPLKKWPNVAVTPPIIPRISSNDLLTARERLGGKDFKSLRGLTMLEILIGTSLRAEEVLSLTVSKVDFNHFVFKNVTLKGGKVANIPFPEQIACLLREWLEIRKQYSKDNFLFIHKNGKRISYSLLKRLMRFLGFNAHRLRHEGAKRFYETSNNDIIATMRFLHHSSAKTTARYLEREMNFINQTVNKAYK